MFNFLFILVLSFYFENFWIALEPEKIASAIKAAFSNWSTVIVFWNVKIPKQITIKHAKTNLRPPNVCHIN